MPLWLRTVLCTVVPTLFITVMGYFATEQPATTDNGANTGAGAHGGHGTNDGGDMYVVPP